MHLKRKRKTHIDLRNFQHPLWSATSTLRKPHSRTNSPTRLQSLLRLMNNMKNYYICKEVLERYKSDIPADTYNRIINDLVIVFNDTSHKLDESIEKLRKENMSMSSTIADLQDDIELFKLIIYRLLDD